MKAPLAPWLAGLFFFLASPWAWAVCDTWPIEDEATLFAQCSAAAAAEGRQCLKKDGVINGCGGLTNWERYGTEGGGTAWYLEWYLNASGYHRVQLIHSPSCSGGRTWNGSACVCPEGQTWNEAEGVCQAPDCAEHLGEQAGDVSDVLVFDGASSCAAVQDINLMGCQYRGGECLCATYGAWSQCVVSGPFTGTGEPAQGASQGSPSDDFPGNPRSPVNGVCPAGYSMSGGMCFANIDTYDGPTCPGGYVPVGGGVCVPAEVDNPGTCPYGYIPDGGNCVAEQAPQNGKCPAGTYLAYDGICRAKEVKPDANGNCPAKYRKDPIRGCVLDSDTDPGDIAKGRDEGKGVSDSWFDGISELLGSITQGLSIPWSWGVPEMGLPAVTCEQWSIATSQYTMVLDPCPVAERIRSVGGYVFYILTALGLFVILGGRKP